MKSVLKFSIIVFFSFLLNACQQTSRYNEKGWKIESNPKKGTLIFTHTDL